MNPNHAFLRLATLLLASAAIAQEGRKILQLTSPGGGGTVASGGYARSVCTIGDIDGDGWRDIAVGHPDSFGPGAVGRVQLVSGRTGLVVRDCAAPPVGALGAAVAAFGDLDGDQVADVLALSTAGVMVFSGSTGALLRQVSVAATAIAQPGDWNGDLVPDIAYVASSTLQVVSGVNGAPIASPGAADDVASIASNTPGTRRLATLAGTTITLRTASGTALWTANGYSKIAAAGDLNGDQLGDVLAVTGNTVRVLSGLNGAVLLNATVVGSGAIAGGEDLDGDSVVDFVVGDTGGRGFVRVYSGANGSLLFAREGQEVGDLFGAAVAMHPGATLALRSAVLVGAPYQFDGSDENGALQAIAKALPGEFDGSCRPFGSTCTYLPTYLRPANQPTIGQTFNFRFYSQSSPIGFTMLVYGYSNTTWNGVPLPIVVSPVGLQCQLLISPDVLLLHNQSSFASLGIPLNAQLIGYTLYVQGWEVFGYPALQASDAATIVIGN